MDTSCASKSTIIKEMQELQDTVSLYYRRVDVIEKKLKSSYISTEERQSLENELQDITKQCSSLEESIKGLRRENSKTFAFAVLLMFFSFLGYGLYRMVYGHDD
ncbi:uncharacterized protein LOC128994644 [Macrosteles quadrilineatus]|uniref:uncharacterized protein LOC128994644 n=1 Tax=Macrosteles quadrilineatus TaxID=74068 RepID=UPI0023E276A5|nr:uncharacterized protein LOC128994644 [Macrosteles quadrilineatus]